PGCAIAQIAAIRLTADPSPALATADDNAAGTASAIVVDLRADDDGSRGGIDAPRMVAIVGATMNEHGFLSIETNASRALLRMAINERRQHRTENPDQIRARDLAVDVSVGIRLIAMAVVNLRATVAAEEAVGDSDCLDWIGRAAEP